MKRTSVFVVLCLSLLATSTLANINYDFLMAAGNMVSGDVDTMSLLGAISTSVGYDSVEDYSGSADSLADTVREFRFKRIFEGRVFRFYPYSRVRPLKYGSNTRIQSLTFTNQVSSTSAMVTANGVMAVRNGNIIQFRQASGSASAPVNKQYRIESVRRCKKIIFWETCRNENVSVERGLQHWELERVLSKMQREAAQAMRNEIQAKGGFGMAELARIQLSRAGLGSLYLDESNALRQLYTQLEYDYSEINNVPMDQLAASIATASMNQISDGYIHARIQQVASSAYRSSFLVAPSENTFFVVAVTNQGDNYLVRFSTFRVEGRVPVGAFVWSVGYWSMERSGEGVYPSIHQLLAIFPPLKG